MFSLVLITIIACGLLIFGIISITNHDKRIVQKRKKKRKFNPDDPPWMN
jgi:hypothetical protein